MNEVFHTLGMLQHQSVKKPCCLGNCNKHVPVIDTYFTLTYIFTRKNEGMKTLRQVKRLLIAVIGFTMIAVGLAMVVLPGPAFIFIPAGLAILATEFIWAKKLLQKVREKLRRNNESKEKPPKNE